MDQPGASNSPDELKFDKAIYDNDVSSQMKCAVCQTPLQGNYYKINEAVTCSACKVNVEQEAQAGNPLSRVLKALAFGVPVAALGSGLYYAIMALTGYELALISIAIGFGVGFAVRKGSNYRGGLPYQFIAVLLTYIAICSTYIPYIIQEFKESYQNQPAGESVSLQQQNFRDPASAVDTTVTNPAQTTNPERAPLPVSPDQIGTADTADEKPITLSQFFLAYGLLLILALASPFIQGTQNIIGILIIGFGLFEAWKINKKAVLKIEGPFELKSSTPQGK